MFFVANFFIFFEKRLDIPPIGWYDKMYDCPITSGIDEMSGICVSAMTTEETEKVAEQLQAKYSELAESNQLYNMDDIIEDYADSDRLVDGAEEFLAENENWLLCEVA